jgi:hypothetical protein
MFPAIATRNHKLNFSEYWWHTLKKSRHFGGMTRSLVRRENTWKLDRSTSAGAGFPRMTSFAIPALPRG